MKKLITSLLLIAALVIILPALGVFAALQMGAVTRSELAFLNHLAQREGPAAVIAVLRGHLLGMEPSAVTDPSYGRQQVEGRGHAPWVLRGNLDERPRMLLFALAPETWAAYDIQNQSLYQVWRGQVIFEGAAYNHQHGPQPHSVGEAFLRDTQAARWFIEVDGNEVPASVHYMGHEYGEDRKTAAMRFALQANDYRLELTEQPELVNGQGKPVFTRSFQRFDEFGEMVAGFRTTDGTRYLAAGTLEFALQNTTPLDPPRPAAGPLSLSDGDEVAQGQKP